MKIRRLITIIGTTVLLSNSAAVFAATNVVTPANLYYPALNTIAGNPFGKITIVEFFDYRCAYCRKLMPVIQKIITSNSQVRVVYRDYPLLGEDSLLAARVAVAAELQNKYLPLHLAFFGSTVPLDQSVMAIIAQQKGLNVPQLNRDMNTAAVVQQLQENAALASQLQIDGIPTLFIADTPDIHSNVAVQAQELISPSAQQLQNTVTTLMDGN